MIRPRFEKFLRGLGVERIADELMVSDRTVYRWLRGDTMPQLADAVRLVELARLRKYPLSLADIRPGQPTETFEARARARRVRRLTQTKHGSRDNEPKQKPLALAG